MLFSKNDVLRFLPHRDPFLFIDGVNRLSCHGRDIPTNEIFSSIKDLVGVEVEAFFYATDKLTLFNGHFPDYPILPGVIQIEIMAQASCFVVTKLSSTPLDMKIEVALLSITNAKFRHPIFPNMDLLIKSQCKKVRGGVMSYDASIYNNNLLMAEATLLASVKY